MKVLMLSTDENIFKNDSEVRSRVFEYGKLVDELHIVVYTATSDKRQATRIGENVFVYPAFSHLKLFCLLSAYKISSEMIRNCLPTGDLPKGEKLEIRNCVITCQDPFETGLVGYLLKKKFKVPLQIQIHTDFLSPYFWRESVKNKLRVLIAKKIIQSADGIRVVSERIKNSLQGMNYKLKANVIVLPLFYDMWRFTDGMSNLNLHHKYPNREFIILSASRLSREKNIGMAVRAMKKVIEMCPRSLLLIVGSGSELNNLKSQVINYRLQDNVIFESWTKDIVSYYKTSDVFVLTSNYEGGARAPVEAISSGLPVIMTDVPPAGELIIDNFNGFIVGVNDANKMSEKVMELISDKHKYLKFKENSLRMAEGFITKETYLKLYYKALVDALTSASA